MEFEAILRALAADTALAVEAIAVGLIAFGALQALNNTIRKVFSNNSTEGWRRELFVGFGMWLLLGLQFALAADIVRSVISPTWTDIGQLAAIAVIRTFLNHFLERDLIEVGGEAEKKAVAAS